MNCVFIISTAILMFQIALSQKQACLDKYTRMTCIKTNKSIMLLILRVNKVLFNFLRILSPEQTVCGS